MVSFRLYRALVALALSALMSVAGTAHGQDPSEWKTEEYWSQLGLEWIRAADAYALGYTGAGVAVGVFDTGVDASHPEFAGQLLDGYDTVTDTLFPPEQSEDKWYHGSHVAGILAARRDGKGMHGVAFDATIVPVRDPLYGAPVQDPAAAYARGWRFYAARGILIINNSFGYAAATPVTEWTKEGFEQALPPILPALREVVDAGALLIWSAGNDGLLHPSVLPGLPFLYPELRDNWITVVAMSLEGNSASYTNFCGVAKDWCLVAPGGDFFWWWPMPEADHSGSAAAVPDPPPEHGAGIYSVRAHFGDYYRWAGTSMAAPHVTGAAALVKQAFPYFTAYHLQQALLTTATDIGPPGVDEFAGWGLLNVGKAVLGPAKFVRDFDVDTQGFDSTFGNDIDGPGALIKRGAGTLTMTGNNSFEGGTFVHGGSVHMTRFYTGPVLGVTLHDDGPVPLTTSDGADVTGTDLVLRLGTLPEPGQAFTILEASDGVSGGFASFPERVGAISFAPPEIVGSRLVVTAGARRFTDPATPYSPNQQALLAFLDDEEVSGGGLLMGAMAELDPGSHQQLAAANQLSGDVLTAFPLVVDGVARNFLAAVQSRLRRGGAASAGAAAYADGPLPHALWAGGGQAQRQAVSDGNGPGFQAAGRGLSLGVERSFDAGTMGLAVHHGTAAVDTRDHGPAQGTVSSTQAAVYAGWGGRRGTLGLSAAAAYGRHRVDNQRHMAIGDVTSTAAARYETIAWAVAAEIRRGLSLHGVEVEPSLGWAMAVTQQPAYREEGDHGLEVGPATFTSQRVALGVRVSHERAHEDGRVRAELRLGYERELGDATALLSVRPHGLGGDWYTVRGTELGRDVFTVGIGFEAQMKENVVLQGHVDAAWSERSSAHALRMSLVHLW